LLGGAASSHLEKVVKMGAKVVAQSRYAIFQMAEVAVPEELSRSILDRIAGLRPALVADADRRRPLGAPGPGPSCVRSLADAYRPAGDGAVARRVSSPSARIRSRGARNRLPSAVNWR
jgi:hypothetical protein